MGAPTSSPHSVSPAAAISRGMVSIMREVSGRGPVSARTTIGRDHVLVMLRETLGQGERNLIDAGRHAEVQALRRAYQDLFRPSATALVEEVLGRHVIGFMSGNHFEPDLAAEVFALEDHVDSGLLEEAEHTHADD